MQIVRARLSENRDICLLHFWRAKALSRRIGREVNERDSYVRAHGLDPDFCMPIKDWSAPGFKEVYEYVLRGDYKVLNRLRFFCQFYSGYSIMSLSSAHGLSAVRPIPDDFDRWIERERPEPDIGIGEFLTSMSRLPREYRLVPPARLGEIGWRIKGDKTILNHDTLAYQERITILYESGVLQRLRSLGRRPRILEIGSGYGALACALTKMVRPQEYVLCDLPESLLFSGLYLRLVMPFAIITVAGDHYCPSKGFTLVSNYKFHQLIESDARFDLVINTLSMSEMSEQHVRQYAQGIARLIGENGLFMDQNQDNRPSGLIYCKEFIRDYFPARRDLSPTLCRSAHGLATLWANRPLDEYAGLA